MNGYMYVWVKSVFKKEIIEEIVDLTSKPQKNYYNQEKEDITKIESCNLHFMFNFK